MLKVAIPLALALAAIIPGGSALQRARMASEGQISGARAFRHLQAQCDFGPRPPGSDAHVKTRDYLLQELRKVADRVALQPFTGTYAGKTVQMWNVLGVINPDARRKIMVCAHWDTRPTADQERNAEDRQQPILGANDGASGVAALLELARVLKQKRPQVGVVVAFWDGEDLGPSVDNMFLGARYFAAHPGAYKPERAILLDMIGDADLRIPRESYSLNSDRAMVETVWSAARQLGFSKEFPDTSQGYVQDDHIALHEGGIPAIDLIDFTYPPWHTLRDTPDKCSPRSLELVAKVLEKVLREQTP